MNEKNTHIFPSLNRENTSNTDCSEFKVINVEMLTNFDGSEDFNSQEIIFDASFNIDELKNYISKQSYLMVATKHMEETYLKLSDLIGENNDLSKALVELMFNSDLKQLFIEYVSKQEGFESPQN